MLIKCRLKSLITLDSTRPVLFTDQVFINSFCRNIRPSTCLKTRGQAFQTFSWAFQTLGKVFEALRENQKLGRESEKLDQAFEKVGRVFKKLGWVFALQDGPCRPNQSQYRCVIVVVLSYQQNLHLYIGHRKVQLFELEYYRFITASILNVPLFIYLKITLTVLVFSALCF